jgi:hypothetical protein
MRFIWSLLALDLGSRLIGAMTDRWERYGGAPFSIPYKTIVLFDDDVEEQSQV